MQLSSHDQAGEHGADEHNECGECKGLARQNKRDAVEVGLQLPYDGVCHADSDQKPDGDGDERQQGHFAEQDVDDLAARESEHAQTRQFAVALTAAFKQRHIMALFTVASDTLAGSTTSAAVRISTLADSIILLRYIESNACVHRALSMLKMRGSAHDRRVRELVVDDTGLHIGEPFEGDTGILSVGGIADPSRPH